MWLLDYSFVLHSITIHIVWPFIYFGYFPACLPFWVLYFPAMSSVKRDSAMVALPWPKSTARSSTSAMALAIQNPDQQHSFHLRSSYGWLPLSPICSIPRTTSLHITLSRDGSFFYQPGAHLSIQFTSRFGTQIAHTGPSSSKRSTNRATSSRLTGDQTLANRLAD